MAIRTLSPEPAPTTIIRPERSLLTFTIHEKQGHSAHSILILTMMHSELQRELPFSESLKWCKIGISSMWHIAHSYSFIALRNDTDPETMVHSGAPSQAINALRERADHEAYPPRLSVAYESLAALVLYWKKCDWVRLQSALSRWCLINNS